MAEGKVKVNMLYLKKGGYLHKNEPVSSSDVDNFDELVKTGKIEVSEKKEAPKKVAPKKSE